MKTIQGKEFDYSDIVLYKLSGNQQKLIVFVDDKEQLEKLKESNDIKDTPVAFLINTSDEEKNIKINYDLVKKDSYEDNETVGSVVVKLKGKVIAKKVFKTMTGEKPEEAYKALLDLYYDYFVNEEDSKLNKSLLSKCAYRLLDEERKKQVDEVMNKRNLTN